MERHERLWPVSRIEINRRRLLFDCRCEKPYRSYGREGILGEKSANRHSCVSNTGIIRVHDLTDAVRAHNHKDDEYRQRIAPFRALLRRHSMSVSVPSVRLRSGHDMPLFGLGTW